MRTPEEVAREWESCVREEHEDGPACSQHDMPWPCEDQAVLNTATLIRARDAEVAETARAENARLREGIAALAETGEAAARHLRALLNPPTEGEK